MKRAGYFIKLCQIMMATCVVSVKMDWEMTNQSFIEVYTAFDRSVQYEMHPCSNDENPGMFRAEELSRRTENPYYVFIKQNLTQGCEVAVTLGSPGTVYFDDSIDAHIESTSNYTIVFKFHNHSPQNLLTFFVERATPLEVPFIEKLTINRQEFCKADTYRVFETELGNQGVQDYCYSVYKDLLPITLPVPESACGTRMVHHTKLIVNGHPTKPGDFPWHVALYKVDWASFSYICGGTLISKFFVLTAAHCVTHNDSPVLPETRSVVLGKYNLRGGDNTAEEKEVHQIIVHEKYRHKFLKNDIALLKLETEVEYNEYIQPACLWHNGLTYNFARNIIGTVVGWGIDHTNKLSSQLQQVQIPIIDNVMCLKSNREFFGQLLDDNNFCAGYLNGTSACNGDSGGGFTVLSQGRYHIRGIVSSALTKNHDARCDSTQYVLFTDVEKYLTWIRNNIK